MVKAMMRMKEKHPFTLCFLLLLISTLVLLACSISMGLIPGILDMDMYLLQLIIEIIGSLWVFYLIYRCKIKNLYTEKKMNFLHGLTVGGYLFLVNVYVLVISILQGQGKELQPISSIFFFTICMFMVGFMEESLCRGILSNILFEIYGKTKAGVKYAVVLSGILFGLFHLSNAVGGIISFEGVLVQMFLAAALGMFLTAVYYRTRNIWVVIFLHGFNDFTGMAYSGFYGNGGLVDTISSYSAIHLIGMLPYLVVTMILLRPSKVQEIVDRNKKDENPSTDEFANIESEVAGLEAKETETRMKKKLITVIACFAFAAAAVGISLIVLGGDTQQGGGNYYNMDAVIPVTVPKDGIYELTVTKESVGYETVVSFVVTDVNDDVIAEACTDSESTTFSLKLKKDQLITLTAYILPSKDKYDDYMKDKDMGENFNKDQMKQALPDTTPEQYGEKIGYLLKRVGK